MIRTAITAIASVAALVAVSEPMDPPVAQADSITAYCTVSWHDNWIPMMKGPCIFSQDQGNLYVDDLTLHHYRFVFPEAENGKTYTKSSAPAGLTFKRKGHYTLNVFWKKPALEPTGD